MRCNDRVTAVIVGLFFLATALALYVHVRRADAAERQRVAELPRTTPRVPLP